MLHTKDDVREVRRELFQMLQKEALCFYAVVRDKAALVKSVHVRNAQKPGYHHIQDQQYDGLISYLLTRSQAELGKEGKNFLSADVIRP